MLHVCTDLVCRLAGRRGPGRRARLAVPRPLRARAGRAAHGRGRGAARGADPASVAAAAAASSRAAAPPPHRRGLRPRVAAYRRSARSSARASSGPERVIELVKASPLLGRGGAAFPTGTQVGGGRGAAGAAALPRLQRRRVRAGDVQGPRAHGAGSVRADRGDGDRRARDRLRARRLSTSAPSTRSRIERAAQNAIAPRPTSGRHRAAHRRRRLRLRRGDGALPVDRGLPRRAAQQAAVPGRGRPVREADGREQRRDAPQRAAHRSLGDARPTAPLLLSGNVARPGLYELRARDAAARAARPRRRRAAEGRAPRRRGRPFLGPTSSTCRSPSS